MEKENQVLSSTTDTAWAEKPEERGMIKVANGGWDRMRKVKLQVFRQKEETSTQIAL